MLLDTLPKDLWTVVALPRGGRLTFTTREEARDYRRRLSANGYKSQLFKQTVNLSDAVPAR